MYGLHEAVLLTRWGPPIGLGNVKSAQSTVFSCSFSTIRHEVFFFMPDTSLYISGDGH